MTRAANAKYTFALCGVRRRVPVVLTSASGLSTSVDSERYG